jgi:hypothetical protein
MDLRLIDIQIYNNYTNKQKCEFLSTFAFFTSKYIISISDPYNLSSGIHINESEPFDTFFWNKLALSTQLAILKSLKDLDKAGYKRTHQINPLRYFSGPWSSFAEYMIPSILENFHSCLERLEDHELKKEFLTILAKNSDYSEIIDKDAKVTIKTFLTNEQLAAALNIAAKNLNVTFMLKVLAFKEINNREDIDLCFEDLMLAAWQEILNQPINELTAAAVTKMLNYLKNANGVFIHSTISHNLYAKFKEILIAHCIQQPIFLDYFSHREYGIKLPNDPEPKTLLTQFKNFKYKEHVAGAACTVFAMAITYKINY